MSLAASVDFLPLGLFWGTSSLPLSDHVVRQSWPPEVGHVSWVCPMGVSPETSVGNTGKNHFFFPLDGKAGEGEPGGCPAGSLWGVRGGRGGCGGAQREVGLGEGCRFAQLRTSCA